MSLNAMAGPAAREPRPSGTLVLSRPVENVDSIGLEVLRCSQCSAGKSQNIYSRSKSSRNLSGALGQRAPELGVEALRGGADGGLLGLRILMRLGTGCVRWPPRFLDH
jgi:hypothetical protein